MNQMEIFQNPEFGSVRIAVDGEKYFLCSQKSNYDKRYQQNSYTPHDFTPP